MKVEEIQSLAPQEPCRRGGSETIRGSRLAGEQIHGPISPSLCFSSDQPIQGFPPQMLSVDELLLLSQSYACDITKLMIPPTENSPISEEEAAVAGEHLAIELKASGLRYRQNLCGTDLCRAHMRNELQMERAAASCRSVALKETDELKNELGLFEGKLVFQSL
ncbi:hypothetical protein DNTS_021764 [Danionella cerebrum]|uniref:Uncharacterized protein n=1 Tax=Danionella cerebrum TaxID=2873325 RepID=A0A553QNQ2_9TELE|nr:hypothetical protein DNTS_021764 [Danionella translucida]